MNQWWFLYAAGIGLAFIIQRLVVVPGHNLRARFRAAGVLKGRTKDEIIAKVGSPQRVMNLPNGQSLLLWQATGYHIDLGFDENDICLGVQSEYAARDLGTHT